MSYRLIIRKNIKDNYSPHRWRLDKILHKIFGLKKKFQKEKKGSKAWFVLQMKRELEQQKKHIIFLQNIIDLYEKENSN